MFPKQMLFLIVALTQMWSLFAQTVQCRALNDISDANGVPIPSERIVRVPNEQQARALKLLGEKPFVLLSATQVADFLEPPPINAKEMLSREVEEAEKKATACRQLAMGPSFAERREENLKDAQSYEQYASHLRETQPQELLPYLVNTKAYFERTGSYRASFKDHHLDVAHTSLGRGSIQATHIAVIVFVESQITDVAIFVSAAE